MTPSSLLGMFITLESIFAGTTIRSVEGMGFGLCSIASYKFYPLAIACVHVYSTCTFQECCKNNGQSGGQWAAPPNCPRPLAICEKMTLLLDHLRSWIWSPYHQPTHSSMSL